jgi:hypothetical protein
MRFRKNGGSAPRRPASVAIAVETAAPRSCWTPIHQHQIDFKTTSPDGIERINQLWLVTYINDAGQETVAQAKLVTGEYAPLIAADAARLESMMPAARGLAKANNLKMRLIKLANRLDIEDIAPWASPAALSASEAVTRRAPAHDQADRNPRDHAIPLGASGRGKVSRHAKVFLNL